MRYQFTCYRSQNMEFIYLSNGFYEISSNTRKKKKNKHIVPNDIPQVKYKNENWMFGIPHYQQ